MLKEIIEKKRYSFHKGFEKWEDAVEAACKPLIEEGNRRRICKLNSFKYKELWAIYSNCTKHMHSTCSRRKGCK